MWEQSAPPAWAVGAAIGGVLLMLAPRGTPGRWLGAAGLIPLFVTVPSELEPGALQVTVLDVGQGVATVVRTANHALLYDAGPAIRAAGRQRQPRRSCRFCAQPALRASMRWS